MKPNTTQTPPPADAPAIPYSPLESFEAAFKCQPPVELFPGMIVHHKDLVLADKTEKRRAEDKQTYAGPINPAGTMTLLTPESMALAILDHRDTRTQVYADNEKCEITCFFDCLSKGGRWGDKGADGREMGWGQHRACLCFTESRKLKEWRKTLEWMGQMDFSNFLEDHLEDVVHPSGQDLLSIATDLEASATGAFKGRVNLDNGSVAMRYQNETETTVEVPRNLVLGVPLFEHGDRYRLGARLRFVIAGGSVKFRLLFTNLQDAKDQEFERIVQEIEEKTKLPIYRGRLGMPW
jgi:hypothetical protein